MEPGRAGPKTPEVQAKQTDDKKRTKSGEREGPGHPKERSARQTAHVPTPDSRLPISPLATRHSPFPISPLATRHSPLLLTGGAGFIGSHLVRRLIGQGYRVLNVDCLTYAGDLGRLADVADHPNYEFQKISITDAAAFDDALRRFAPDAVLHLAAETHVDRSIDGPRQFVETNVGGTFNCLQSSLRYWDGLEDERKERFRLLHVSTDEVYGHLGPEGLFTEQSPYAPRSPYSASKAASDHLVRAWGATYGLPVLVVNCSNNYGPAQHPEKLIPLAISRALQGQPIPIYGRGENVRDWLYVEDHCEALQAVLERGQTGETYNVGGSCEVRNIDLVTQLCERLDTLRPLDPATGKTSYKQLITYVEDRPGHDFRYAIDATKLRTNLGWTPRHTLQAGLDKTVRWFLESGERRAASSEVDS